MLEDRHLPSIFVRMYEHCLLRSNEDARDEDNNCRLRLLNYVLQRWHETRGRLTFYRDVFKVIGAVAKPVVGDHISIAVEGTPVNQQHVVRELFRTLRSETNGRSMGEFLESWSRYPTSSTYSFHDLSLNLFTREDVLSYERGGNGSSHGSLLSEALRHPIMSFGKRVLTTMVKHLCSLRLNMSTTVSRRLFGDSVPSWAEEDTEEGTANMDENTRLSVERAKDNIRRMLIGRRGDDKPPIEHGKVDIRPPTKFVVQQPRQAQQEQQHEQQATAVDDDAKTVDTESFIGEEKRVSSLFPSTDITTKKRARFDDTAVELPKAEESRKRLLVRFEGRQPSDGLNVFGTKYTTDKTTGKIASMPSGRKDDQDSLDDRHDDRDVEDEDSLDDDDDRDVEDEDSLDDDDEDNDDGDDDESLKLQTSEKTLGSLLMKRLGPKQFADYDSNASKLDGHRMKSSSVEVYTDPPTSINVESERLIYGSVSKLCNADDDIRRLAKLQVVDEKDEVVEEAETDESRLGSSSSTVTVVEDDQNQGQRTIVVEDANELNFDELL